MEGPNVKEIRLPKGLLKEKVTICLVQLKSPFDDEISEWVEGGNKKWGFKPDSYNTRKTKLANILEQIKNTSRHIDILIFPEYSFDEDMINDVKLKEFAKYSIIIGNYYDRNFRKGTTFVLLPDGTEHKAIKQCVSDYDKDFLIDPKDLSKEDKEILRFCWEVNIENNAKEKAYFQIFTCKDFLVYTSHAYPNTVDHTHGGIIIVPMCTPSISEFKDRANFLMREATIDRKLKSIVTALCNATTLTRRTKTCGGSQIVGPYKGWLPIVKKGIEGGIIVDINPLNAILMPTPIQVGANAVLISPVLFEIDKTDKIKQLYVDKLRDLTVNPNAYMRISLKKYYGLFRLKRYYHYRGLLSRYPIKFHGTFGYHDLLAVSLEEESKFLDLRIDGAILKEDLVSKDYLEIIRTIKFRGITLVKIEKEGEIIDKDSYNIAEIDIDQYKNIIRDVLLKNDVQEETLTKLKSKKILIKVKEGLEDSCIVEGEKESGKNEFLVLIFIFRVPDESADLCKYFNKHVLLNIIEHDEIRTIEQCRVVEGMEKDVVRAHYILHIVGDLKDLTNIVIEQIHTICGENNIEIGTRVVLPVESLSLGEYHALCETPVLNYKTREIVKEIIHTNLKSPDPFVVKRLDIEGIDKICEIYTKSNDWLNTCNNENLRNALKEDRNKFIEGVCCALGKGEEIKDEDLNLLKYYCDGFFTKLAEELETILHSKISHKEDEVSFVIFKQKIENASRTSSGTIKDYDKLLSLGKLFETILLWNRVVCENDPAQKIKSKRGEELTSDIQNFQKKKVDAVRNWFSHTQTTRPFCSKEDIHNKLLDSTASILEFLLREKYEPNSSYSE